MKMQIRDLTAGTVSKSYALEHLLPKQVAEAHLSGDIHFHDLDYHPFQPLTNCCLIDAKDMLENGFEIGNAHVTSPKSYALEHLLPKQVAEAHLSGDIHFHDLDYHPFQPLTNCCLIDAKDMLENGFEIGNAHVTSPKSIQTASAQLVQIIANVSSSQYGGCTVDRVDELLSTYAQLNAQHHREVAQEFVQPDKLDAYVDKQVTKDIGDAIESLEYEINTLYTSNGQTPFVTLDLDLGQMN